VIPLIQQIVGGKVRVIDPAPAVARQVRRLLEASGTANQSTSRGAIKLYTSGDSDALKSMLPTLLGEEAEIEKISWLNDSTIRAPKPA
jgi:glutamate racemase